MGGRFTSAVDSLDRRYGVAIAAGMLEEVPGEARGFNTVYVTNVKGDQLVSCA